MALIPIANENIVQEEETTLECLSSSDTCSSTSQASCEDIYNSEFNDGDGQYWIDLDGEGVMVPLKVTCDMTNGGWTRISYNQSSQENYQRFRDCNNNGYYFGTNFECINPNNFTNIKFTRSGKSDITSVPSSLVWEDQGGCLNTGLTCRVGWSYTVNSTYYTMRDYNNGGTYNSGRWESEHGIIQNQIVVWGK